MSKIKRVVLYKHGVGHFERGADVEGDAEIKLAFRTEEMNDVLKSLTVFDKGGGVVSSVSYDNKKPISKLLADITLDIPDSGGHVQLLGNIRGAQVSVVSGARTHFGQIVGVDTRFSRVENVACQRHKLTIFDDQGRLQAFDLDEITHVGFMDEDLQNDMRFLFETVFSAKKQDAKTLKIFSRGEGERTIDISYVVECPVWKTSYRVALPSEEEDSSAYLQGWALVDNPQDEDWKDVELSLVSGLPISFRHDLYSPRYLQRKEIEVERESSAGPVMAEGAIGGGGEDLFGGEAVLDAMCFEAEPMPASAPAPAPMRKRSVAKNLRSAPPKVETVTQKVGQLFEYKIDKPVTVLRNQSALVPIVSGDFEGGKKLLYNRSNREENPFSVVDFHNTTGLTLEGGPVTVYEGSIYAGEAMMDTVGPGEERMLPYAVALDVEVKVETDHSEKSVQQSVTRGAWRHKRASYFSTQYKFVNKGEARTLIVEHPYSDASLVNTPKPTSETRTYWRFTVALGANTTESLTITEKRVQQDSLAFVNSTPQHILLLIEGAGSGVEHKKLLAELKQLLEVEQKIGEKLQLVKRQTQERIREQARIRENLKTLGDSQEERSLRSRYVNQLDADETELPKLRASIESLEQEQVEAREAFLKKANKVSLERVFEEE